MYVAPVTPEETGPSRRFSSTPPAAAESPVSCDANGETESPDAPPAFLECACGSRREASTPPATRSPIPRTCGQALAHAPRETWPCSSGLLWSKYRKPDKSWCRGKANDSTGHGREPHRRAAATPAKDRVVVLLPAEM